MATASPDWRDENCAGCFAKVFRTGGELVDFRRREDGVADVRLGPFDDGGFEIYLYPWNSRH